tara:strand:- start:520 stop:987 length:468 start_codon:yes stop_codon:yes gene_type:complete
MFKIYKIVDNTNGNVYIGRTTQKLRQRLAEHKCRSNKCISQEIIKNGDYEVEIIEQTDDKTRERYWIENTDCINERIPCRTQQEWEEENKEKRRARSAVLRAENREEHNEKERQRYAKNREKVKEKQRQRREENREEYNKKARQRYAEKKLMRNQ